MWLEMDGNAYFFENSLTIRLTSLQRKSNSLVYIMHQSLWFRRSRKKNLHARFELATSCLGIGRKFGGREMIGEDNWEGVLTPCKLANH